MEMIVEVLKALVMLFLHLALLGLGTERGTQLVKVFLRLVSKQAPWLAWLSFSDSKSFILAAVVSFFVTYYFGVNLTPYLTLFAGFSPELVTLVTALLSTLFSNVIHTKYFKADA
jgi:hypothetical protein